MYEIFANRIKWEKFDIEYECQCQEEEKLDVRRLTGNVQLYIEDFFSEF